MIVLRCVGSLGFLLLASCAGQLDTSKYALSQTDGSVPPVRFSIDPNGELVNARPVSRTDINPDGTLVNAYPVASSNGSSKKHTANEMVRIQSDAKPGPVTTSELERPAIRTGLRSPRSDEPATTGALAGRDQPRFETPVKGSVRWEKEEAENEKLEKQLNERLRNSICTKC